MMGINNIVLNLIGYIYGCLQTSLYDILKDIFFKMLVYQEKYIFVKIMHGFFAAYLLPQ